MQLRSRSHLLAAPALSALVVLVAIAATSVYDGGGEPAGQSDEVTFPVELRSSGDDTALDERPRLRLRAPCAATGCDGGGAGVAPTIAVSPEGTVTAVDPSTGSVRWSAALPEFAPERAPGGHSSPGRQVRQLPSMGGGLYVAGPGWVALFDDSAQPRWIATTPEIPGYVRRTAQLTLFHSSIGGQHDPRDLESIAAHATRTGEALWQRHVERVEFLLLDRGIIVVTLGEGQLARLHPMTGEVLWSAAGSGARLSPEHPATVLITRYDGTESAVDLSTGQPV